MDNHHGLQSHQFDNLLGQIGSSNSNPGKNCCHLVTFTVASTSKVNCAPVLPMSGNCYNIIFCVSFSTFDNTYCCRTSTINCNIKSLSCTRSSTCTCYVFVSTRCSCYIWNLIVSTVRMCPVPVSSVAKLVAPDVCSYVQIHKPPPYLTTSFTLYLVVVA